MKTIISVRGFRSEFRLSDADLAKIHCPTLIIWGTNDPLGGTEVARNVEGAIADARLETLDAGHGPWFGHPDKVAKIISEFAK